MMACGWDASELSPSNVVSPIDTCFSFMLPITLYVRAASGIEPM